jgi:rhamnosyltransferase
MRNRTIEPLHAARSWPVVTDLSVCAIIVTYHPSLDMLENVDLVLDQVQGLVVVDNGSNPNQLAPWQAASRDRCFKLIENGVNLGIAEALNQGISWAQDQGFSWVILFDQDSKITPGYLGSMFETWRSHPERDRICSIFPNYTDPDTGKEVAFRRARDGGPIIAMTSGALMPTWIFDKIGRFRSDYFVDEVDAEYCFRSRAAGYLLADSRQAVLHHQIGLPKKSTFLGFGFTPTHHNAVRRYYMSRNRVVLYKQYFFKFPARVLKSISDAFLETTKCFLGEEDRVRKLRNFLLGTWDGLIGRMGKREDI